MGALISSLLESLFQKHLELIIVGLDNAGKSSLVSVLAQGAAGETAPTVGLQVHQFKKGNLSMKAWDLGGQAAYRSEWARYARGVDVIVFVVSVARSWAWWWDAAL